MVLAFAPVHGHETEPTMTDPTTRERVRALSHWLAHQRAVPSSMTEASAWRLVEAARDGALALEGPRAPLVVQARFSLWLVGQLAGRALMRIFVDQASAVDKARELGREMRVPVLVIGPDGDITERIDPVVEAAPEPVRLVVGRFEDRWAVFVAGKVIATAPTRDRARQRARTLKADPDFMHSPQPIAQATAGGLPTA